MSFQRKALKLTWPEGSEFHGLEILCRRPSIEQVGKAEKIFERSAGNGDRDTAVLAEAMRETVGATLIRWNYKDEEGMEVAATPDGFLSLDLAAQMEILGAWVSKSVGVPKDLGKESGSGHSSPARLSDGMPTVTSPRLSNALLNLPMHSES